VGGKQEDDDGTRLGGDPTNDTVKRILEVCLITEGTYPFHDGGVSVWCDQLVRGMAPHEFVIDAITATGIESSSWDLPANVGAVRSIPLWGPTAPLRTVDKIEPADRRTIGRMLHSIMSPTPDEFLSSLEELFVIAQEGRLRECLLSEDAVRLALDALSPRIPNGRSFDLLPTRPTIADAVASLRTLEHLLRPLEVTPPDVDLCHASSNGSGVLLAMAAKWKHRTPFLLTEHGLYLRERYIAYSPATLPHHQRAFMLGFYKQLTTAAYQMANIIAPGSEYNSYWEEANGADPSKIQLIYNGIDAPTFEAESMPPEIPTIAWVGRIDPLKDVKTMLRAFAMVREEMPEVVLRMFGGIPKGNTAYMNECLDVHEHLGLGDSARFEGRIPSIVDAYHAGHVVVSTSISEGFPYSVLEAMACGRAMIATDVGGVGEAVNGVGVLVPPRNPRAVADACLLLLRDSALRSSLAERGRTRVRKLFTLDVCIRGYQEIYSSLTDLMPVDPRRGSLVTASAGLT
jgi:polysaccharide biosynthesis protein PelF